MHGRSLFGRWEDVGRRRRRRSVKISPGPCGSHSELLVPEMLPLASSLSLNADPGSSICVRAVLLGRCWDTRGVPASGFASAQSSSCNLDGVSVPWAGSDKRGPIPATQGPCLAPDLQCQALFGLGATRPEGYRRGQMNQYALLSCQLTSLHVHPFKAELCLCLKA